jgi:serine/threonine protein kinase
VGYSAPDSGQRVLVYEFLPGGSLADNLTDDQRAARLTWKARVRVLQQVATALNYMHKGGGTGATCFHRDVKSANICLTASLSAKLIDCGLAMFIPGILFNIYYTYILHTYTTYLYYIPIITITPLLYLYYIKKS